MFYQLPNGNTIEISTEQYLSMTDNELADFLAYNTGGEIQDPWYGSVLSKNIYENQQDVVEYDLDNNVIHLDEAADLDKFESLDTDLSLSGEEG